MINTNTVLVLGAGASQPYGLPLGIGLRAGICAWESGVGDPAARSLWSKCGISPAELQAFAGAFRLSSVSSIDAYLARHPDFQEIGKLCIAWVICNTEETRRHFRLADFNETDC